MVTDGTLIYEILPRHGSIFLVVGHEIAIHDIEKGGGQETDKKRPSPSEHHGHDEWYQRDEDNVAPKFSLLGLPFW